MKASQKKEERELDSWLSLLGVYIQNLVVSLSVKKNITDSD